jgi:tubulin-specific chaperone C
MEALQSHGTSGGERQDAVDHCQASITRLTSAVKDASSIIPAYDQRTYGEALKALSSKLQSIKDSFAPRPKFAFKSGLSFTQKKNASAISLNDAAELAEQRRKGVPGYVSAESNESSVATTPAHLRSPAPERADDTGSGAQAQFDAARIRQMSFSQSTLVKIDDHDGLHIILPPSAGHATSSGTLSNLRRCVVDLSSPTTAGHPFAGLTLKNISESLIICGQVAGALHITNVKKSVIVVASRQFRMHESRSCDVYLLTTSRPIIEDCSAIHFAPLPEQYVRGQDKSTENQWNQVDDFKWLRSEPSPNWTTLNMPHRVREEVWRDVVRGGPSLSVDDILKAVNVPV